MSISSFDREIVSSGSWRSKTWLIVYFKSFVCGPDKLILSVKFLFQLTEKGFFYASFVLFSFVEYYFLSNVSMELV